METKGITWELGNENETKRAREETKGVSKMVLEDLEMIIQLQHTGLLSVLEESLKEVPLDEEDGFLLGSVIQKLQGERGSLESSLDEIKGIHRCQLKHLEVPELEKPPIEIGLSGTEEINQEEVLQTVTVCLADVKKDIRSWVEPMKAEYISLTQETQAVEPVHVGDLDPNHTEFVPGKMVCVIGVYASGADGTLIRTVIRHAALRKWGISTTDIKTAFLLAPRVLGSRLPIRERFVLSPQPFSLPRGFVKPPKGGRSNGLCMDYPQVRRFGPFIAIKQ